MPSSTFSSSAAWALKLALTGAAVIVVASVADPPHMSLDERSVMTMATLNQLVLERYVQGQTQRPIVFVGSSILTAIPPPNCRSDTVASIYLQGWGAQTGLEAIRRTGATPRVVFVELTRAMIGPDPQILESAFTPFYYYPRRYFSALRQNRNLMTMLYSASCRRARTDAGGAIGREAVDTGTVASSARIKPGEPREALHREPLNASDVPCRSTCPAAPCPGRRG